MLFIIPRSIKLEFAQNLGTKFATIYACKQELSIGNESFKGTLLHSAAWDVFFNMTGKYVSLISNGQVAPY